MIAASCAAFLTMAHTTGDGLYPFSPSLTSLARVTTTRPMALGFYSFTMPAAIRAEANTGFRRRFARFARQRVVGGGVDDGAMSLAGFCGVSGDEGDQDTLLAEAGPGPGTKLAMARPSKKNRPLLPSGFVGPPRPSPSREVADVPPGAAEDAVVTARDREGDEAEVVAGLAKADDGALLAQAETSPEARAQGPAEQPAGQCGREEAKVMASSKRVGPTRRDKLAKASARAEFKNADFVGPLMLRWKGRRREGVTVATSAYCGPVPDAFIEWIDVNSVLGSGHLVASAEQGLGFDPLAEPVFKTEDSAVFSRPSPRYSTRELGKRFRDIVASQASEEKEGPYLVKIDHKVRPGETVSEVLDAAGLMPPEVDEWISAASKFYDLNHIYAGQLLTLTMVGPEARLVRLELEIGPRSVLAEELDSDNQVVASRNDIVLNTRLKVASGTIESSLYMAALSHGVPEKIVSEAAEVLGWEIHFAKDLRPGATFRVAYEELFRRGRSEAITGRLIAVEINNKGKNYEGFYFAKEDENIEGYFKRDGKALGRYFLRYPVAFSRISSHFNPRRYHPLLKRNVAHNGVDFAAPTGTPVHAVADGKVLKALWDRGNGRFVKMRHDNVFETGYAHLSRIAKGVQPGALVKKGQVIGYVGSTGLATGPHLHFAMYKNGKYVDPLKANVPRAQPLKGAAMLAFRLAVDVVEKAYARAAEGSDGDALAAALATEELEISE